MLKNVWRQQGTDDSPKCFDSVQPAQTECPFVGLRHSDAVTVNTEKVNCVSSKQGSDSVCVKKFDRKCFNERVVDDVDDAADEVTNLEPISPIISSDPCSSNAVFLQTVSRI